MRWEIAQSLAARIPCSRVNLVSSCGVCFISTLKRRSALHNTLCGTFDATITPPALEELCINTLRFLAVDMVQKANLCHPGLAMGSASMACAFWDRALKFNPRDPGSPDRDRFVLSTRHGCALLYALFHVTGFTIWKWVQRARSVDQAER
jgi:hypothetical protein